MKNMSQAGIQSNINHYEHLLNKNLELTLKVFEQLQYWRQQLEAHKGVVDSGTLTLKPRRTQWQQTQN
jgi:hypothetical protein